jgi:hypothetical protein
MQKALLRSALMFVALAVIAPTMAFAQPKIAGHYDIKFDEVANNCTTTGMNLSRASIELTQKGRFISVTIPMVPLMKGTMGKTGKFKAKAKRGKTAIQGVDGKFAVAGRVDDGLIQIVFIAEYFNGKRPLCTQSWNGSGVKKEGASSTAPVMQPVTPTHRLAAVHR